MKHPHGDRCEHFWTADARAHVCTLRAGHKGVHVCVCKDETWWAGSTLTVAMKLRDQFREVWAEMWRRLRADPLEFAGFVARYWLGRAHIGPSDWVPEKPSQGQTQ